MKLHDAIQEFLIASEADGLENTSIEWYRSMLKSFHMFFIGRDLTSIAANDLRKYLIHIRANYSPDTWHGHMRVQHRFWKWCATEYQITNAMRNIKYPALPKQQEPRRIEIADMARLFKVFDDSYMGKRDKAIFCFLSDTGCRVSGLCGLTIDSLDMENRRAYITEKGRKRRAVVFTEFTARILQEWLDIRAQTTHVFYNIKTLEPFTRWGVEQLMKRLRKKAGIKGRTNPHAFRHAFGIEYLKAGGDLATLSKLLGHANVETTVRAYGLFTKDDLAEQHEKFSIMNLLKDEDQDDS